MDTHLNMITMVRLILFTCMLVVATSCTQDTKSLPELANARAEDQTANSANILAEEKTLTIEEQLVEIKAEYALISQEMQGEVYTKDSIAYSCEEDVFFGDALLYSDAEETRLVIINSVFGDHAGETEYWYLKNGKPFFVLQEMGTWQFGGPLTVDESGEEVLGTIDKVEQLRYYIAEGKVIRKLRKAFEIKSWEDSPGADEIPNEEVATDGALPASYEVVEQLITSRKIPCEAILE
ncbi:MAG: hypothetical protein AAF597_03510 [Bacteroidota bacterium]